LTVGLVQIAALFLLALSLVSSDLAQILDRLTGFWDLPGFSKAIFLTTNQTLLMLSIPSELRGRVISIVNLSGALSFLGGLARE